MALTVTRAHGRDAESTSCGGGQQVVRPVSSVLLCFTPRSGSTLLAEALSNTGVAGYPEEYFNWADLAQGARPHLREPIWQEGRQYRSFAEYLGIAFQYGMTANGVFASKLAGEHLPNLVAIYERESNTDTMPFGSWMEQTFPNPKYIWVTRRDKVRQAVSWFKSIQTDTWIQRDHAPSRQGDLTFDSHLVEARLRRIIHEGAQWNSFFDQTKSAPFTVVYEDLIADYEGTIRRVLDYLSISIPDGYSFPSTRLHKQADEVSEKWVQQYYAAELKHHRRRMYLAVPTIIRSRPLREYYIRRSVRKARRKQFEVTPPA